MKLMARHVSAALLSVAAVTSTSGCGQTFEAQSHGDVGEQASSISYAQNPKELVDFIRSTVHYDYEPASSPSALLGLSDIAVVGTVETVEGALQKTDAEDTGVVLITLEVTEIWKKDGGRSSELVTYVIPRPTNVDASMYRRALPAGTRVAMFGTHAVETLLGDAAASPVYDPAPQGLIFEIEPGTAVNVWGGQVEAAGWADIDSIEQLRTATLNG